MIQIKGDMVLLKGSSLNLKTEVVMLLKALNEQMGITREEMYGCIEAAFMSREEMRQRHMDFLDSLDIGEALAYMQLSERIIREMQNE